MDVQTDKLIIKNTIIEYVYTVCRMYLVTDIKECVYLQDVGGKM